MAHESKLQIEVAYALPQMQLIISTQVEPGTTLEQAIRSSGILEQFPDIDLASNKTGIFGKLAKLDTALRDQDRVEIYRALIADPKESRRQRAQKKDESKSVTQQGGGGAQQDR